MGRLLPTKGEWSFFVLLIILMVISVYALITFSYSERFVDEKDEDFFSTVARKLKETLG